MALVSTLAGHGTERFWPYAEDWRKRSAVLSPRTRTSSFGEETRATHGAVRAQRNPMLG
jgi:hypothetical protein